jgi:hypothetical protein
MNDLAGKTPDLYRNSADERSRGWSSTSFSWGGNVRTLNGYPFGYSSSNISQVCGYIIKYHSV